MKVKWLFAEMNRKLEEISKLMQHKDAQLNEHLVNELAKLADKSAEIAEEWLKFEEKLGKVISQGKLASQEVESEEWMKGKALYDLFMYKEAIPYLEKTVALYPEFDLARLYLAHAYLEEKRYDQARLSLQFLIHTLEDGQLLQVAYHTLGCLEGMAGHFSASIYYFEKIDEKELLPEWKATYLFNFALSLFLEANYDACLEKLMEYYQLAASDWKGPYLLGKVYLALGDEEAAIAFWFEALQLQENICLLKEMARHFEEKGYYQMAAHCYQRVLRDKRYGLDREAWHGLAWTYGLAFKKEASEATFLKAFSLFPDAFELLVAYAWLLIYWEHKPKAKGLIDKLLHTYPEHPLVKGLPLLYEGKYKEALQLLHTV